MAIFIFVRDRYWSTGLVSGRTTLVVGGLHVFVVSVIRVGALPTAVGRDVAT